MFNELLTKACLARTDVTEVMSVRNMAEAEESLRRNIHDLVILDTDSPHSNGFEFANKILFIQPRIKILGISAHCDQYTMHQLAQSELTGFVNKSTDALDQIWHAFHNFAQGKKYFSPSILALKSKLKSEPNIFSNVLSTRETLVLRLVGEGKRDGEIGERMTVTADTVKWHRKQIMRKLGLNNQVGLIIYANQKGLGKLCNLPAANGAAVFAVEVNPDSSESLQSACK